MTDKGTLTKNLLATTAHGEPEEVKGNKAQAFLIE